MIIELWIIKFLITDIVCSCWSSSHIAELSISLVCWMVETRARERLLHKRSQGVVELSERLDMNGKTGASVVSARIQDQPWERVVALQNISETHCINIDRNKYYLFLPQHISGVVAVKTVNSARGWLRHETVVSGESEVGAVDVESWLEKHRVTRLQVRSSRPEPDTTQYHYHHTLITGHHSPSWHGSSAGSGGQVSQS